MYLCQRGKQAGVPVLEERVDVSVSGRSGQGYLCQREEWAGVPVCQVERRRQEYLFVR